ncbi:MAG: C4-dicarboxylate ABC transporter permease, partial [candidate division Zixibacteria bacterium]|nr:C4-dicarboxylate ABC transporter permease [candidate division Zixibacteria bacterium]
MEILSNLIDGFSALLGTATIPWWEPMLVIIIGTSVGILIGVLPGLSASTGLALIVPFTFGMDPLIAIILLATVYGACSYGGSITAIAINTPGTPAAVAVAFDGYYLTKNGQPGRALGASLFANSLGGIIGALVLIFFAVPLARGALYFGPPAFFSLAIFGLTIVSSMESGNRLKGFISTAAGLLFMTVGLDIINAHPRFTFGRTELFDGFSFIPALIGLFALGEVLLNIEKMKTVRSAVKTFSGRIPAFRELWAIKKNVIKSGALGALIGA